MGHSPSTFLKFKIINNKQYANEQLQKAESLDYYLSECYDDKSNSYARRKMTYAPNILSDAEIEYYTVNLDNLKSNIPKRLQMDLEEIQIIQLMPSADGGMPHTRPYNLICLPAYFPEERLETTIQHELVHLDQRRNPLKWHNLLKRDGWKIENQNEIIRKIPNDILNRCRLNPDTLDIRFVSWQERYIPFPLFVREDKPELRDIQIRWFDLQEKTLRPFAPTSFLEKYGNNRSVSEMEHPYEYYAYAYENR